MQTFCFSMVIGLFVFPAIKTKNRSSPRFGSGNIALDSKPMMCERLSAKEEKTRRGVEGFFQKEKS